MKKEAFRYVQSNAISPYTGRISRRNDAVIPHLSCHTAVPTRTACASCPRANSRTDSYASRAIPAARPSAAARAFSYARTDATAGTGTDAHTDAHAGTASRHARDDNGCHPHRTIFRRSRIHHRSHGFRGEKKRYWMDSGDYTFCR